MYKISIIFINLSLSVLLFSLISWFEKENIIIESTNKKHLRDIRKLEKISSINKAIEKMLSSVLKVQPKNEEEADLKLIQFFDKYAKEYSFGIQNYVYKDTIAHYLEISYTIDRADKELLREFMNTKHMSGFIKFTEFNVEEDIFKGKIKLIQPYKEEKSNASQQYPVP